MGEAVWLLTGIALVWLVYAAANRLGWLDEMPDTPEALFVCPKCPHTHPDGPCCEVDELGGWVSDRCRCTHLYAVP